MGDSAPSGVISVARQSLAVVIGYSSEFAGEVDAVETEKWGAGELNMVNTR